MKEFILGKSETRRYLSFATCAPVDNISEVVLYLNETAKRNNIHLDQEIVSEMFAAHGGET